MSFSKEEIRQKAFKVDLEPKSDLLYPKSVPGNMYYLRSIPAGWLSNTEHCESSYIGPRCELEKFYGWVEIYQAPLYKI